MLLASINQTYAFRRAQAATGVKPYSALKLDHIVETVDRALAMIHGQGFFTEYTRHGPEHSAQLVKSLDWLIEEDQRENLSDGDYLFLVLACLLHDIGMLTTKDEFIRRDPVAIFKFEQFLNSNERGRAFLDSIPHGYEYEKELIFEEFVRHYHAIRSKNAILGISDPSVGDVTRISASIESVFHGFDKTALNDLAFICESHHNEDLDDLSKYPIKSVHGTSEQAQVNLQAVAILLRVADVLQIGTGRTPSVDFSLISPSNPISFLHWTKEMGVQRVIGEIIPATSAENPIVRQVVVYGSFYEAEPYFALQAHLRYAGVELSRCVRWTREAKSAGQLYQFLWDRIDPRIKTHGFEPKQFSFQIDREKILQLLIGHTLYNDTRVVLRELVQNSVDAVRLKAYQLRSDTYEPRISVQLNNRDRKLVILDNGTGMTAATIESHLLTVGSSYYASEEFGKSYPDFTAISRFGIGILTSFMIADKIEILTSHPDEEKARVINIDGPSGTYLVKLVEKSDIKSTFLSRDHGTQITLHLRPNTRELNLIAELSAWFAFPACELTASTDGGSEHKIGFDHPALFLESLVRSAGLQNGNASDSTWFEVVRHDVPNFFEAAYLVRRSRYSSRSYLATTDEFRRRREPDEGEFSVRDVGIFLQGIRVLSGSPGFENEGPIAVINGIGKKVPRTNVARSGIEKGSVYENFLRQIYDLYLDHWRQEIEKWSIETENSSLTTKGRRISYLINTIQLTGPAVDPEVFQSQIDSEKRIVVEVAGKRRLISRAELLALEQFDTVESSFLSKAESLIESLPSSRSLNDLIRALELPDIDVASEVILTNPEEHLDLRTLDKLSIGRLRFSEATGQLNVNWLRVSGDRQGISRLEPQGSKRHAFRVIPIIVVPPEVVDSTSVWPQEAVINCEYAIFLHPKNSQVSFLAQLADNLTTMEGSENFLFAQCMVQALSQLWSRHDSRYGRSLEEIVSVSARGDAEGLLGKLKDEMLRFRTFQVINVGKDEYGWF